METKKALKTMEKKIRLYALIITYLAIVYKTLRSIFMSNKMKKTNGNSVRLKGYRAENELRKYCEEMGVMARRNPLSGALPFKEFKNDVLIAGLLSCEVKSRAKFADYTLLEIADKNTNKSREQYPALIKKGDRKPYLVEMYLSDFLTILNRV